MKLVWVGLAFLITAGVGSYIYFWKEKKPVEAANSTLSHRAIGDAPVSNARSSDTRADDTSSIPPWMQQAKIPSTVDKPASAPIKAEKRGTIDAAFEHLQKLQQSATTDIKEVSAAILQVEQANGSPVLHGIRLDVLRHNLEIAEKIKELASKNKLPPNSSLADISQIIPSTKEELAQLESLQKQLRIDIIEKSSTLVGSKP